MKANLYISIILLAGIVQGAFLSAVLLTLPRGNKAANKILGTIILLFSSMILPHIKLSAGNVYSENFAGQYIIHMIFFLVPPLILYYVRFLTEEFKLKVKDSFHFLPFVLLLLLFIFFSAFNVENNTWRTAGIFMTYLIVVQFIFYLYFSLRLLKIHRENIEQSYSYSEKINLNWLRFLIWGQIIVWISFLIVEGIKIEPHEIMWIPLALFIYLMGYFSMRQPEVFAGNIISNEIKTDEVPKKKYAKSALSKEMSEVYYCRLMEIMKNKKPYLKNDLTLQSLASLLSISNHHLSQVINEKLNQNFFEFVNSYRIEEAKALLSDPKKNHLTMAAVAFEAGFNSVSSFNTVFKKLTNITPSGFRNLYKR